MRLLIVCWHRGLVGGSEHYVRVLIPELLARGHDVGLVYGYEIEAGRPTVDPPATRLPAWCVADLGVDGTLRAIADWKPDVHYSHGSNAARPRGGADRALSLRDVRPRFLRHLRDRLQVSQLPAAPSLLAHLLSDVPVAALSSTLRRAQPDRGVGHLCRARSRRRRLLPRYDAVIVASRYMREELSRHRVAADRLHLVAFPASATTVRCQVPRVSVPTRAALPSSGG